MSDIVSMLFFGGLIVAAVSFVLLRIDLATERSKSRYRDQRDI